MVGVLVPEVYVGQNIPEKTSDPTQQTLDNNNFPKTESGGFFKHFEGFFKSFKKKVKSNKPDPPKTEINLSTAVKSIIQDTTTKTTIIGSRNIGKSFLINTLLESTAPSDKEYAEQRDAVLFAEQIYRNTSNYSFSEPIHLDPEEPITSYKGTTAYEFGTTNNSTTSSTDMDESYTYSTGYAFTDPETTSVDDVDFEWEIGKIEQTLVPDENFINTIQWDKEEQQYTLDDLHSFLMPQGVESGCIEMRHGKIPELIVTFVDETKLRQELWEVHEVEAGTRRIKNIAHKQLLESRYRTVLGLSKQQKIPLGHIKSPRDFVLSPDVLGLLGKSFRFRGLGENFNLDRIYVREKLRDVVVNYSFYVCNLLVKMPCGLLEGNKDLVEISNIEISNAKTIQSISTANLLIVLLDKKGITSEIAETMRSTGFLEKALRSPEQHKAVFIEMSETIDKSSQHISEPSIKVEFESYKHCISLQYKLLLSEQTSHWSSIEKVVSSTTVLSVRPRLFSLLHAGRDSPLIDRQSHLEALSATSIPALVGCIANMSISKCSEQLREMNSEWMNRISVPASKTSGTTTAVPLDKAQELLGRKTVEDEKMDEVTVMLDQLTVSFHDKFDRFRTEMVDTIESLDAVLVPKAQESVEQCDGTKAEGNALMAAYVSKLMSGPLAKAAPVAWSQNVAQVVPKKIQDLLNYSDAVLKECVSLVERTEDNNEKSRLKTLVHFCQGTHERAVKRLEDFKKQLHSDTMPIVKDACVDAVFRSMGNIPEISLVAAKNIKAKFSEKLKCDMQHLDMMEKDLQRALKSIMVVLKAKPNSSLKIEVQQSLRQLPLDLQFMKKVSDEDLVMRYAQEEKYEKREPWSTITSVYTAYEDVDTSRIFNKNSWSTLDPARTIQFQEQLAKAGLVAHNVTHDASSQYRSLAHQVYGTEDAHSVVRLLLMSEILSNPSNYERYISMKGLDIQEYVSRSAKDTEWGDHLSLCAFANFYGSDLLIYSPMFTHPLLIQTKNPQTNRVFCIAYVNVNEYKSLKEEVKREIEDVKITSGVVNTQTVVTSVPKHYKVSQETKAKCFSPISLVQLCLHKISQHLDIMPSLVGLLPEELTQRLLTLLISQRKVDDSVLERLVDSSMRTVELDGCQSITDASCRHIARSCDDLRRISLSNCIRIGNESLVQFSYQCPNLEYLNLSGCTSISNSGVTEIIRRSKNLQYLNLTGCSKITDAALNEISLTCPQLHSLIVKDCNKITDQAFHFVNKNIMVLDLSGCELITDQCIVQIAKHCSQLSSLKISSKNITDESICFLAERCRMLSVVDMSGCEMISDISVKSLGKNCPMLETLNLSCCKLISNESFTDAEIRPLFPYLTSLDLSRCLNISDDAIQVIATDCDRLESIQLSSCEDITDSAIVSLVNKCNKLKEVNVSKCINITDVSALELAKCSSLEKLSLYNCHKLTDQGLSQIGIGCSKLKDIDISSCQNITDISISALTQGCPFIESLSIEECNISENGINSIAENCILIQTLKLACCKGVTSNSIEKLGKGCPQLTYLDLSYCGQVSMSSLRRSLNLWPNLKYLSLRGFQHISNESIEHANLQELNLSWCKNIVDAAVEQIANGCPNLVNIDLAWANKITANSIHKLAQKVPSLKSLNLRGCAKVALLTLKYLSGGNVMIYT